MQNTHGCPGADTDTPVPTCRPIRSSNAARPQYLAPQPLSSELRRPTSRSCKGEGQRDQRGLVGPCTGCAEPQGKLALLGRGRGRRRTSSVAIQLTPTGRDRCRLEANFVGLRWLRQTQAHVPLPSRQLYAHVPLPSRQLYTHVPLPSRHLYAHVPLPSKDPAGPSRPQQARS